MRYVIAICIVIAGCATVQSVTLLPRGEDRTPGRGTLDRMTNVLTVDLKGQRYQGTPMMQTATTSRGLFGAVTSTTTTSQASALLLGAEGQVRCDYGWDALMTRATGVCVDYRNVVYDLLIQN